MSSSQPQTDQSFTLLLVMAFMFAILWVIWHFGKHPILEVLRALRFVEMWVMNLITGHRFDACMDWLHNARFADPDPSADVILATNNCFNRSYLESLPSETALSYYSLSIAPLANMESGIMYYARWPMAIVFVGLAYYAQYVSPRNKFKTQHNLESFIKTQAEMWPVISPIVNFNPMHSSARAPGDKIPDKLPLFAEALSPEEWISYNRITVTNNIPDRDATRRGFLLQLGPRWTGTFIGQPAYIKALSAACALKGVQRREESDDLLGRVSQCWSEKSGLVLESKLAAEIEQHLRDEKVGGEALAIANQHAYRTTAMLGMLRWARSRGGVLAPAQFLWLRGTDRVLWYALNNLGRRAFLMEGAGALAHFMAEQNARKALPIPRIDTALVTLNQYMAEKGMPIPPREEAVH